MGGKGKSEKESPEELRARALLERELDCQLVRVRPGALPTVDYRAPAREAGIEVKRVTVAEYYDLTSAWAKITHFDSQLLTGRWSVAVDRPTLSTTLAPVPDFPADDQEAIAYWEGLGYKVQRRADRVAEWRATHPGTRRATPRLDTLAQDLEPHLVVLEAHGLTTTRGAAPFLEPEPLATALTAIQDRTQGALCLRHELFGQQRPGIDVVLGAGFIRTGRPDTIPQRLQLWLDSPMSANYARR